MTDESSSPVRTVVALLVTSIRRVRVFVPSMVEYSIDCKHKTSYKSIARVITQRRRHQTAVSDGLDHTAHTHTHTIALRRGLLRAWKAATDWGWLAGWLGVCVSLL
jgi:hypothetical protein